MKNLDEKIYNLLNEKGEKLSVSQIQKELKVDDKRELMTNLQSLNKREIIFRKIIKGKVYYSINEKDGEGKNPTQKYFSNLQEILNNISDINEKKENEKPLNKYTDIDLKYTQKQVVETKNYSLEIPDGFKIINNEGENFVAYLEDPQNKDLDWDKGGSIVSISRSYGQPISKNENDYVLPEFCCFLFDKIFWKDININLYGDVNLYKVKLANNMGRIISITEESSVIFHVMCPMGVTLESFFIQFYNTTKSEKELKEIVINIINKLSLKVQNKFLEFDNPKYLSKNLDEKEIDEYANLIKSLIINFDNIASLCIETCEAEYDAKKLSDDNVEIKPIVINFLQDMIDLFDKYLIKIEKFIETAKKNNINKKDLKKVYAYSYIFINSNEEKMVDIDDGDEASVKSKKSNEVKNKIFTNDIMDLIKDFKIDE